MSKKRENQSVPQDSGSGWVEESWSFSDPSRDSKLTTGPLEVTVEDVGSNRNPLDLTLEADNEEGITDPWGEFLTIDPATGESSTRADRGDGKTRNGIGPSSPLDSSIKHGWNSLVQLGQQFVKQHEEKSRGVVRNLFGGLQSRGSTSASSQSSRSNFNSVALQGNHSSTSKADSSTSSLSQPLLSNTESSETLPEDSLASGLVLPQPTKSGSGVSSTWAPTGLPRGSSKRGSREGELVVPLKTSASRSSIINGDGSCHNNGEYNNLAESDGEDEIVREEMLRIGMPLRARWGWGDGSQTGHSCWQKSMEVLPVLAVVAFLALGTVAYFTLVDRVLAAFKSPFSLSCKIEVGAWVPRSSSSLSSYFYSPSHPSGMVNASTQTSFSDSEASVFYSPSCPYIRDEFNCGKFGLPELPDGYAWQPDACQLSTVTPNSLLKVLRNKGVAFVGDMTIANQFDSFVCQLAQQETPVLLAGDDKAGSGRISRGMLEAVEGPLPGLRASSYPHRRLKSKTKGKGNAHGVPGVGTEGLWDLWPFSEPSQGQKAGRASSRGSPSDSTLVTDVSAAEDSALGLDTGSSGAGSSEPSKRGTPKVTMYRFPLHNVTVTFYHSPFLVKTDVDAQVNATACQQSKAALAQFHEQQKEGARKQPETLLSPPAQPSNSSWNGTEGSLQQPSSEFTSASLRASVRLHCYPNTVDLALPDSLWSSEAGKYSIMLLSSGRGWTEEAVERAGLGIAEGGKDQEGVSLEGLQGQWAYPRAMAAVAKWLENSTNFPGAAVFRSYSPSHERKQCASRARLSLSSEAFQEEYHETWERYNDALEKAIDGTRHLFLNITALSFERADGHPWMASPARPKADCGNWCLPGVPDTWNHVLGRMILEILKERGQF